LSIIPPNSPPTLLLLASNSTLLPISLFLPLLPLFDSSFYGGKLCDCCLRWLFAPFVLSIGLNREGFIKLSGVSRIEDFRGETEVFLG
jgi:hypothetical protein